MNQVFYKVHLKDGRFFLFPDYQYLKAWWAAHHKQGILDFVEIIDSPDPD